MTESYEAFQDALAAWLRSHKVPEKLHRRLYDKIQGGLFDTGNTFVLARWPRGTSPSNSDAEEDDTDAGGGGVTSGAAAPTADDAFPGYYLVANRDVHAEEDVWLVDHCCTFQLPLLREELLRNAPLRSRFATIVRQDSNTTAALSDENAAESPEAAEHHVQQLWGGLWPYVGSYDLLNARGDDAHPHYWFMPDEIGGALSVTFDEEEANVRLVTLPFYFASQQCVFSFFWPTSSVDAGTVLTRRPHHRFESFCGEAVSRVLYESWSGEPPKGEVVQRCREVWQSHYREQAYISAQRNVQNQLEGAAKIALRQQQKTVVVPTYPPLSRKSHPSFAAGNGDGDLASRNETNNSNADVAPLAVYVSHRGVAAALAAAPAFQGGDSAVFCLASVPGEAAIVWMTNHAFRTVDEFSNTRFVVHLPEHTQLTNTRNLAALEQHAVGKTPLAVEHLDGVSQLSELIGSVVEESSRNNNAGHQASDSVWELVAEDGRRVWGPLTLDGWPRVRELLRVAEVGPLCLTRVVDAEAYTLVPGARMILHFPVLVRSLQSNQTGLEAYLHRFNWASFLPASGPVTPASEASRDAVPSTVLENQLAALTHRTGIWETEVLPVVSHILRDILVSVAAAEGLDHSRFGAVWDAQFQLLAAGDGSSPVMPVLVGFGEQIDTSVTLQHAPLFFADALNTLCFSTETNVMKL